MAEDWVRLQLGMRLQSGGGGGEGGGGFHRVSMVKVGTSLSLHIVGKSYFLIQSKSKVKS